MFLEWSCRILPFARPTELVFTLLSSSSLVHFRAICPLLHAESGLLISPPRGSDGNRFEPHLGLEAAHLFGEVVAGRAERFLDHHFQSTHHCDAEPPQALESKADGWLIVASDFCDAGFGRVSHCRCLSSGSSPCSVGALRTQTSAAVLEFCQRAEKEVERITGTIRSAPPWVQFHQVFLIFSIVPGDVNYLIRRGTKTRAGHQHSRIPFSHPGHSAIALPG